MRFQFNVNPQELIMTVWMVIVELIMAEKKPSNILLVMPIEKLIGMLDVQMDR